MNKTAIRILISIGILGFIYLVLSFTGGLKLYSIPTPSNEPTLMVGDYVLTTNFKKEKPLDFIVFNLEHGNNKTSYIKRLVAQSGDTLEIIDGEVFVNRINMDKGLDLSHAYLLSEEEFNTVKMDYESLLGRANEFRKEFGYLVNLPKSIADQFELKSKQLKLDPGVVESIGLHPVFSPNWNSQHFGPLVIPEGKNFVLGDSRNNSHDSRYMGYVDDEDILGVVIYTF